MDPVSASTAAGYSSILSLVASRLNGSPVLITGDLQGAIKIWQAETVEPVWRPISEHDACVSALASDPSRPFIASGGLDRTVRLWDIEEAQRGPYLGSDPPFGDDSEVWSVAACGSMVAARSYDRRIRLFDLETGALLGGISSGAHGFEKGIALSDRPGCRMLAFDLSGEIFIRELGKRTAEERLGSLGGKAAGLLFHLSEGVNALTAISGDGRLKTWDVIAKKEIRNFEIDLHRGWRDLPEQWTDTVALGTLGDGRAIVLSGGSGSGVLRVWNADGGELIREIPVSIGGQAWTSALAFGDANDRQWIASGNSDGTLILWDARNFEQIATVSGETSIFALAITSIAGRPTVLWGGKDHVLHAWWPETNRRESIDLGFPVNAIADAPDETVIVGMTRGIIAIRFEM